ncbi:hypothetical protein ACZ90_03020 [Streptomyces albus subsp. albus]|uniref:hypothetical protein n=1 Tax=Streptomyces TaxID=1883 RepID=UPI0004BD3EB7|nr:MULTISPECIES: hypothetical protein [Streptomyces]KOG84479.1 hypothetical protein ADK33_03505 [Streptomyces griseus subsp. rhodochrous]KUJ70540.1 hypothetical protein ACZ90_03020 [Streptomyces albus subsp. albus]
MAATTSGAIKARLEGLQFGVPVFRDGPREKQSPPFIVVTEALGISMDTANGDFGDPDTPLVIVEKAAVDLIETARTKATAGTARATERYGLAEAIAHALHGHGLPAHPAKVTAVRVTDIDRFPISDNRIRASITLAIHRELLRSEVIPA